MTTSKILLLIMLFLGSLMVVGSPVRAFSLFEEPCQGEAANSPVCRQNQEQQDDPTNPNPVAGPDGIIQTAANIIAIVAGVAAVIVIIISGLMFVTAGGSLPGQRAGDSPTRAKSARAALMYALIGLAVIAFAWSFITFITHRVVTT